MACPTKEEYEEAMQNVIYLKDWIVRENKCREDLIDRLCISQESLKGYKKSLDYYKEIVQKYQIYQEILAESK